MSGIAGVIFFDQEGADVQPLLEGLVRHMPHRATEGVHRGGDRFGSLAYLHRSVTRLDHTVRQPLCTPAGQLLVADARLDNRPQLAEKLSLDAASFTEAELLMAAWQRWGDDMLDHVIGDFAVAIWDATDQTLHLLRDHSGARPLFYYHNTTSGWVAFASEVQALVALPQVPRVANEKAIALYLNYGNDLRAPTKQTFFEDIYRVRPAHAVALTARQRTERFVWTIQDPTAGLTTPEEYAEAFGALFREAVRCRMQSDYPIASELSGGMDSSSVAATARHFLRQEGRLLTTVHFDLGFESSNERSYAQAVVDLGGLEHHWTSPLPDYYQTTSEIAAACGAPDCFPMPSTAHLGYAQVLRQKKVRTLLTGHDGDSVVGYGFEYLDRLFEDKDWEALRTALYQLARHVDFTYYYPDWNQWSDDERVRQCMGTYMAPMFISSLTQKKPKRALTIIWHSYRRYQLAPTYFLKKFREALVKKLTKTSRHLLADSFVERIHLKEIIQKSKNSSAVPLGLSGKALANWTSVYSQDMLDATEQQNRMGQHYGYEVCHPFLDKRLIEFCLFVPDVIKYNQGLYRGLLRRAMEGFLPDYVRLRGSKMDPKEFILTTLLGLNPSWKIFCQKNIVLEKYISKDIMQNFTTNSQTGNFKNKSRQHVLHLRVIGFYAWYRNFFT
ncbi:lasso peptide isopeptide bond-forming cyclase [Rhabdobacter roseus]|uniref:asparagine synthase (glutamine-hydrolyzing) n=1 Tax=Rhabdobacter roseus TaxID=1655419 RepID=A0A840THV8_9BACT|nr:asparagine synthase-related protein [Rhabdobacter roseus]MBB5282535.1 asparagine synthase (glutamine-hydrolyzing) [Rhabdobacter roseus]